MVISSEPIPLRRGPAHRSTRMTKSEPGQLRTCTRSKELAPSVSATSPAVVTQGEESHGATLSEGSDLRDQPVKRHNLGILLFETPGKCSKRVPADTVVHELQETMTSRRNEVEVEVPVLDSCSRSKAPSRNDGVVDGLRPAPHLKSKGNSTSNNFIPAFGRRRSSNTVGQSQESSGPKLDQDNPVPM